MTLSSWDVAASPEQYVEEIELEDYIRALLVDLALEVSAVVPTEPMEESTSTPQPSEASQVSTVDKGKGPLSLPREEEDAFS